VDVPVPQNSGAACNEDVDSLEASCYRAIQDTFDVSFFLRESDGAELGVVSGVKEMYGKVGLQEGL
jgi:hypothetical protein